MKKSGLDLLLTMDHYRCVLEVLKMTSPEDILNNANLASTLWAMASSSNELWDEMSEMNCFPVRKEEKNAKYWFKKMRLKRYIPVIKKERIWLFSVPDLSMEIVLLKEVPIIKKSTVYCFIKFATLLCCGGSHNLVYEINLLTLQVRSMNPMSSTRNWAGILKHKGFVYVIGGSYGSCYHNSGEKYSLKTESWTTLKGVLNEPRNGFTPCVHCDKVYCTGRWRTVEVMDIDTELFTLTPFLLESADFWSLSTIYEDSLVVVHEMGVLKYDLKSRKKGAERCELNRRTRGFWSNCPPVRYQSKIYSILNPNPPSGIVSVDLENYTVYISHFTY